MICRVTVDFQGGDLDIALKLFSNRMSKRNDHQRKGSAGMDEKVSPKSVWIVSASIGSPAISYAELNHTLAPCSPSHLRTEKRIENEAPIHFVFNSILCPTCVIDERFTFVMRAKQARTILDATHDGRYFSCRERYLLSKKRVRTASTVYYDTGHEEGAVKEVAMIVACDSSALFAVYGPPPKLDGQFDTHFHANCGSLLFTFHFDILHVLTTVLSSTQVRWRLP